MALKKKVGLALSGGFAKGLSHIGVLEVIENEMISIDYIAGTSIGALIGALWAKGFKASEIRELASTIEWKEMLDFTIPREGFLEGKKIQEFLDRILKGAEFKDLKIPMGIVALDIRNGEKVVFQKGNVAQAIRCSISYPGIFTPVRLANRELIDGGIVDPIPVDVVREMGANFVIAVNLAYDIKTAHISTIKLDTNFLMMIRNRFFRSEINYFKESIKLFFRIPKFLIKTIDKILDWLLSPKKVVDFMMRRSSPRIIDITVSSFDVLDNQLKIESVRRSKPDILIQPRISDLSWADFGLVGEFMKRGYSAAKAAIPEIRRKL